ncbi:hypothetical protein [Streptomyces cuspidosporus]|uniref:hypothetical protein n=1 Tax=Streptomyces cuspidosporus TaxID=66882 RepID=UPI003D15D5BD
MCLFSGQGYEEVARLPTQGLERVRRWEKPWRCRRQPRSAGPGAGWGRSLRHRLRCTGHRSQRLVLRRAGLEPWAAARHASGSAYPQARVAALVEYGTHAVFAAAAGPLSSRTAPDSRPAGSARAGDAGDGRPWHHRLRAVAGRHGHGSGPVVARPREHRARGPCSLR